MSFNKKLYQILQYQYLNILPQYKCKNEVINLFKDFIISQMQDLYPIPKDLLSYFIKDIFDGGFFYIDQLSISFLIKLIQSSKNKDKVLFDIEKVKKAKNKNLLFICIPYKLQIWLSQLKQYFDKEVIEKLYKDFNNEKGISGQYSKGFLIIINSNYLKQLKDIEEIVQHQFVHFFRSINEDTYKDIKLSMILERVLVNPNQLKTYTINLMNRLDKIFNKYCITYNLNDSYKNKKQFLDKIFLLAEKTTSIDKFYSYIKEYDQSFLLYDNLYFLWLMCHWKTKEFQNFKRNIYNHFQIK